MQVSRGIRRTVLGNHYVRRRLALSQRWLKVTDDDHLGTVRTGLAVSGIAAGLATLLRTVTLERLTPTLVWPVLVLCLLCGVVSTISAFATSILMKGYMQRQLGNPGSVTAFYREVRTKPDLFAKLLISVSVGLWLLLTVCMPVLLVLTY